MKRSLFFMLFFLGCSMGVTGCEQKQEEKIQITYATYAPSGWDAITMFNASSDTYEIVEVPYLDVMDDFEQYEDYLKQLNLQILAGTGPDIWFAVLSTWGENPNFVGLPRENRQGILQYSSNISMNGASKNKEGVWEFFKFLLSEQYQSTVNYFPVRREQYDVYWEYFLTPQIHQIPNEVTGGYIEEYEMYYVRDGKVLHCLLQEDKERMEELIECSTTFVWEMDITGYNIIYEEASCYYSGQKSIEEVMELIENRISLYLEEKV